MTVNPQPPLPPPPRAGALPRLPALHYPAPVPAPVPAGPVGHGGGSRRKTKRRQQKGRRSLKQRKGLRLRKVLRNDLCYGLRGGGGVESILRRVPEGIPGGGGGGGGGDAANENYPNIEGVFPDPEPNNRVGPRPIPHYSIQDLRGMSNDELLEITQIFSLGTSVADIQYLVERASDLTSLESLTLGGNFGDAGAMALAAPGQPYFLRLTSLSLARTNIGPAGCAALASILPPSLESLELANNPIGDNGIYYILAIIATLGNLRHLDLRRCGLHGGGIAALATRFQFLPRLASLYLSENLLEEEGSAALVANLPVLQNLMSLFVSQEGITAAREAAIRGAGPPGSHVVFDGDIN